MQEPTFRSIRRSDALEIELPFSESEVAEWLFFNQEQDLASSLKSASVPQGPGELLKWKAFNQDPDCFVSKIASAGKPKKKILISNALLKDRPPRKGELALMSALVKYYEVYLWQNNDLSKAIPLSCGDDFWRLRDTIQPATATAMAQFFAEQQMAADEWLVLDQSAYQQRWGVGKYYLDLTVVDLASEENRQILVKSVDCEQITFLNLLAPRPEVLQFIRQYFNNLKIIRFTKVSAPWLEKNIALLENSGVETIELHEPIPIGETFNLKLKKNYGVKTLAICELDDAYEVQVAAEESLSLYVDMEELGTIKGAVLIDVPDYYLEEMRDADVSPLQKQQPIFISDAASYHKLLERGENRTLTALTIKGTLPAEILQEIFTKLAANFPHLQALKISADQHRNLLTLEHPLLESFIMEHSFPLQENLLLKHSSAQLVIKEVPKLSHLEIDCFHEISPLTQRLPALRRLHLQPLLSGRFPAFAELTPSLELLDINQKDTRTITSRDNSAELILADSIKSLRFFEISQNMIWDDFLKIRGGKNLRSLSLDICTEGIKLELAASQHLEKLYSSRFHHQTVPISSLDTIPPNLLLMEFNGYLEKSHRAMLPPDCVSNVSKTDPQLENSDDERVAEQPARRRRRPDHNHSHRQDHKIQAQSQPQPLARPERSHTFFSPLDQLSPAAHNERRTVIDLSETLSSGKLQYSIKALNSSAKTLHEGDYRIQIFNRIAISAHDQIVFSSHSSFLTEYDYQHFAKPWVTGIQAGKHTHRGQLTGDLTLGKNYPLATNAPVAEGHLDLYVEFEPASAQQYFKVGWHRDAAQGSYYVRLLPIDKTTWHPLPTKVSLRYHFTPQKHYPTNQLTRCVELPEAKPTFSPSEKNKISKFLKTIPELALILGEQLSLTKKLSAVINYLRQFDAETPLLSPHPQGCLEQLADIIQQRRGVCAQRSHAFMLLAHFLGVEAQLVTNGVHAYCEIREAATGNWTRLDFGGRAVDYRGVLPPPEPEELLLDNPTEPFIRQHLSQTPVFSWSDFVTHAEKPLTPVVISLPEKANINSIRREFFQAKQLGDSYLFINTPEDFRKYWQSYSLQDDGSRCLVPGPLQHIFSKGGTLLINWTNFTSKQQLFYQSLWADQPRWEDKPITSRAVRIVGFLSETLNAPPSFMARCNLRRLPDMARETKASVPALGDSSSSSSQAASSPSPALPATIAHFDVFKSTSWQELLVADIEFLGARSRLLPGFFYQAITEAQRQTAPYQLVIHQPPQDSEFAQFLSQIDLEKRFFFNGKFHAVPDNFLISTTSTPLNALPKEPPFALITSHPPTVQRYYLHANNWHSLYQQIIVDSEGGLRSVAGRLAMAATAAATPPVFYLTQTMPDYEWQQLAHFILTKHRGRRFYFQMADGVTPPPGYALPAPAIPTPSPTSAISPAELAGYVAHVQNFYLTTNDPDYLAERLQQLSASTAETMIIDLTPAMSVADLLVSIRPNPAKAQELNFIVEKKCLFAALEAGKTVILKGQLSPRLQQELAPLFSQQPHLECNGQIIPIRGRLWVVQPATVPSPAAMSLDCNFASDDYRAALTADKAEQKGTARRSGKDSGEKEQRTIEKLLRFFYLARIPHRGRSMPADLGLSFTRLRQMKQLLLAAPQASDHQHNRLKGLMLHDYDKGSEGYAFFNVLLKIFFDKNKKTTQLRHDKFQGLQQRIAASKGKSEDFAWRLLNTCSGEQLRKIILGKEIISDLVEGSPPPESLLPHWTKSDDWAPVYKRLEQEMRRSAAAQKKQSMLSTAVAPTETRQIAKMQRRLAYLAQAPNRAKVVVIKGEPGVGKTHYLEQLTKNPDYSCNVGLDNIEQWLKDTSDRPRLLLLDEANTLTPGMLDLLDGIHRRPACIVYQGKSYLLSPQHKIFAAVNPEYFSGRYYHSLLRKGETVLAPLPDVAYLENYLVTTYELSAEIAKALVAGAELFKRYQPLKGYSFRDLQNLVQRYEVLCAEQPVSAHCVYAALYGEFAVAIANISSKQQFANELRQQLRLPATAAQPRPFVLKTRMFPAEMQEAHAALSQALDIRSQVLAKADAKAETLAYKRGLLLQGAAGVGKKLLCQQLLQAKGLVAASGETPVIDPTKQYLEVTAGEASFRALALKAFNLGAILVVNQLNFLSPDDERFLGGLLMGRHESLPAEKPGFLVIATQNPNSELGGGALSPALCNRMQILSLPSYADSSWELLAQQKLSSDQEANQFTQAFWHPKEPYPKALTGHDFFSCLEKEMARLAAARKYSKRELDEELLVSSAVKRTRTTAVSSSQSASNTFSPRLFPLPSLSPPAAPQITESAADQFVSSLLAASSSDEHGESATSPGQRRSKRKREGEEEDGTETASPASPA